MSQDSRNQVAATYVSTRTIELLKQIGEIVQFKPGETIARQGTLSDEVFLVLLGEAEIWICEKGHQTIQLAIIRQGALMGEMGPFLGNAPRTANIRALTALTLLRMTYCEFQTVLVHAPDLMQRVLQSLTARIQDLNEKYQKACVSRDYNSLSLGITLSMLKPESAVQDIEIRMEFFEEKVGLKRDHVSFMLDKMKKNRILGSWFISGQGKIKLKLKWDSFLESIRKHAKP